MQVSHNNRSPSAKGFGHEDVVAGNLYGDVRSERGGAGFVVAEVAVKSREWRARTDDTEVDSDAIRLAEEILRSIHYFAAQAGSLPRRIHAEQAQVATVAAKLDVNATSQAGRIFGEEEFPFCHVGANASGIDAVAFDEGLLDAERDVNQADE